MREPRALLHVRMQRPAKVMGCNHREDSHVGFSFKSQVGKEGVIKGQVIV